MVIVCYSECEPSITHRFTALHSYLRSHTLIHIITHLITQSRNYIAIKHIAHLKYNDR
jgi:hypothetical protein